MEEVTTKDGRTKTVVGDSQQEVQDAVKVAKGEEGPTYPNINVPVPKGHDLAEIQPDLGTRLVDGRGAHNSPHDAINADGSENGDPSIPVPGADEEPYKSVVQSNNGGAEHVSSDTDPNPSVTAQDAAREANKDSKSKK